MDYQALNNATYDRSAEELAAYFAGIGARIFDIEKALELAGRPQKARVVEIGCGDGRDAVEIQKRVESYHGFDPSDGLLSIAQKRLPKAQFTKADALSFTYPPAQDVVFAFASLLHVPKQDMSEVFQKISQSLKKGGVCFISTKEADQYEEKIKEDRFGKRMFYFYSPALLEELAGPSFKVCFLDHQTIGHTRWFTLGLQRVI